MEDTPLQGGMNLTEYPNPKFFMQCHRIGNACKECILISKDFRIPDDGFAEGGAEQILNQGEKF